MPFLVYTGFCGISLRHSCAIIATIKMLPMVPVAINMTKRDHTTVEIWVLLFFILTAISLLLAVVTRSKWFCIVTFVDLVISTTIGIIIMITSILVASGLTVLVPKDILDIDIGIDMVKLLEMLLMLTFLIGIHIVVIHINLLRYVFSFFKELEVKDVRT